MPKLSTDEITALKGHADMLKTRIAEIEALKANNPGEQAAKDMALNKRKNALADISNRIKSATDK